MLTLKQAKQKIKDDSTNWSIHLTDFVDDFRYYTLPFRLRKIFVLENFLSRV